MFVNPFLCKVHNGGVRILQLRFVKGPFASLMAVAGFDLI